MAICAPALVQAQSALDPTFGSAGLARLNLLPGAPVFRAAALLSDGRFLVAGGVQAPTASGFVARLHVDGRLDESFGRSGFALLDGPTSLGTVEGLQVLADGRIVVAGGSAVVRLLPDGQPDVGFGAGGRAEQYLGWTSLSGPRVVSAALQQPGGSLITIGTGVHYGGDHGSEHAEVVIGRMLADGRPDLSFREIDRYDVGEARSVRWYNLMEIDGLSDFAGDRVEQVVTWPDGRALALVLRGDIGYNRNAGGIGLRFAADTLAALTVRRDKAITTARRIFSAYADTDSTALVAYELAGLGVLRRYFADGTPDSTFGVRTLNFGGSVRAAACDGGGCLAVVSSETDGLRISRLLPGAEASPTIGPSLPLENANVDRVVIGEWGGALLLGSRLRTGGREAFVARVGADGSLDPTFGANGVMTFRRGASEDRLEGLAARGDRVIVAGSASDGASVYGVLLSLHPDGRPDAAFGDGGRVATPYTVSSSWRSPAILADGSVLALSISAVGRFLPDGRLDPAFGVGGVAPLPVPLDHYRQAQALTVMPDGRIVVAGNATDRSTFAARLLADGRPDVTFGGTGAVVFGHSFYERPSAVTVDDDGRVIVAGGTSQAFQARSFVARFKSDGVPDSTFGVNGVAVTEGFHRIDGLLPLERRLIAASTDASSCAVLLGFDSQGRLDPAFGSRGVASTGSCGLFSFLRSVAALPDGRLVAVGGLRPPYTDPNRPPPHEVILARFNSDGQPDASFPQGGGLTQAVRQGLPNAFAAFDTGGRLLLGSTVGEWAGADVSIAVLSPATTVAVDLEPDVPAGALVTPFPNPFRSRLTVRYTTPSSGPIHIAVYDVLGREVARVVDESQAAGAHEVEIDTSTLPAGVYVVRLRSAGVTETRAVTRVR